MQKVLVIVGPTGIGKSKLSVELAQSLNGEIISGDAFQVYQELNIGTAKIRKGEMNNIKHYCIDDTKIEEPYNVAIFQNKCRNNISLIASKKHLPIICGGTGLYIKAALYDYIFKAETLDEKYQLYLNTLDNETAMNLLKEIDHAAAKILHENNRKRVDRALMIAHLGTLKSDNINEQAHVPIYDIYIVGLDMDRDKLYNNINQRVDKMIEKGLKKEIIKLVDKHPDIWQYQCFQGIGYKEYKSYFNNDINENEVSELIKKHTRNFAKRQYTFFRNQLEVNWYNTEKPNYISEILSDISKWMEK